MIQLRQYQEEAIEKAYKILLEERLVYLTMAVRTGKTITSFMLSKKLLGHLNNVNLLFITTKKAIDLGGIKDDFDNCTMNNFNLELLSMDSIHKANDKKDYYSIVIVDESHLVGGAFPKPSGRATDLKKLLSINKYAFVIMLSGTPCAESKSQLFHQFWCIPNHSYSNTYFYAWARINVEVTKKFVGSGTQVNDYKKVKTDLKELDKYFITVTQQDAEFTTSVEEKIITIQMPETCKNLIERIRKDRVIEGKTGVVLADTGVKLMSKIHQLSSGTVKLEDGKSIVISNYKAEYIKKHFNDRKCVIFYIFTAELEALKSVLGDEVSDTKQTKHIALQLQSGARAITLKEYDNIIYYNIAYSAELYFQSRDRMSYKEREENVVYWLFSDCGLEKKIYKQVQNKKDYSLKMFENEYGIKNTKQDNSRFGESGLLCFETNTNE